LQVIFYVQFGLHNGLMMDLVQTEACSQNLFKRIQLLVHDRLDAQLFLYNTFILIIYMFRTNTCPSLGGQLY